MVWRPEEIDLYELLPPIFKEILDFQFITSAELPEYLLALSYILRISQNFYPATADLDTIKLYEEILGIIPDTTDTLEIRRWVIINRFSTRPPYTLPLLKERLNSLVGVGNWELEIDYPNYTLDITIHVSDDAYSLYREVQALCVSIIPAHIKVTTVRVTAVEPTATLYVGAGLVPSSTYYFKN